MGETVPKGGNVTPLVDPAHLATLRDEVAARADGLTRAELDEWLARIRRDLAINAARRAELEAIRDVLTRAWNEAVE